VAVQYANTGTGTTGRIWEQFALTYVYVFGVIPFCGLSEGPLGLGLIINMLLVLG